ncbi:hypothetical protein C8R46DRAFT_1026780 [Mycena filopes]|nr:hypothetical protein C8R46DRAFT_1026780 [Mycena filopes]
MESNDVQKASVPEGFRDPAADIILRSSDDIDFHVHRLVLSLASPVFRDMFGIPQPPEKGGELPVVRMAESGAVLGRILNFWYPGGHPTVENLDQLREILEILIFKYDMQSVVPMGQGLLRGYVEAEPLGSFAVAVRHGWDNLALVAANGCLKLPLRSSEYKAPSELAYVPATAYHSLLQYHYRCGEVLRVAGTEPGIWLPSYQYGAISCGCRQQVSLSKAQGYREGWLLEFFKSIGQDLSMTPGSTNVHAQLYTALERAAKCNECRPEAFKSLPESLLTKWWPHIQNKLAEVKLDLKV